MIFTKQVLTVDEKEYAQNIKLAYTNAFNLAFKIAYTTKENIRLFLQKAYRAASLIADKGRIITGENVEKIISRAGLEAEALKSKLNLPDVSSEESAEKNINNKNKEEKHTEELKIQQHEQKIQPAKEKTKEYKKEDSIREDEAVAQKILKRLQDEKMGKQTTEKEDRQFKENEKVAQDVLKKIQDEKMKKEGKK